MIVTPLRSRTHLLPAWVPYAAPFVLFLVMTALEGKGGPRLYPIFYAVKLVAVGGLLLLWRRKYTELTRDTHLIVPSVVIGAALCALWVLVDGVTPHFAFLGTRESYNPISAFSSPILTWTFIAVRFFGLCVIVPIMEELFWRAFVLRLVIDPEDFQRVPLGTFEPVSFAVVTGLMAAAHPEWLAAACFSAAMNLWLYRTKNLMACVIAHGATNFALGVYVLISHEWKYW